MSQRLQELTLKSHIESLISNVSSILQDNLNREKKQKASLCHLQSVNYNEGNMPDYTNIDQVLLYLLRYGPAYTIEYMVAYNEILQNSYIDNGEITILSIGCGALIDKASAYFAMQRREVFKYQILNYYGVDVINWNYDAFSAQRSTFLNKGIQDVQPRDILTSIDIIMFPKSICEIPENILESFIFNMNDNSFCNKLCIIASNRHSIRDDAKLQFFCEHFCDKFDYRVTEEIPISVEKNRNIWSIFDDFIFDQSAIDLSNHLYNYCGANESCDIEACQNRLNRYPVLTVNNFNTTVYCLEKN